MSTRDRYEPRMVAAARQVLLELASVLEDERDKIVFVGGTACALLFPQETDPHEGTIDVDVALDPDALADYGEDTLEDKLTYALYQRDTGNEQKRAKSFRWFRNVYVDGEPEAIEVGVDLLIGEYEGGSRRKGPWEVQGLFPGRPRGLDLAFLDPRPVPLSGLLPNGTPYETSIRVCSPASLLAMKGIAISGREEGKDKDAYDIDYILRRYDGGPDALARVLQTDAYWHNGLVQEGLRGVAEAFHSLNALGPTSIATANRYPDADERAIALQGAFLRVRRLMRQLGIAAEGMNT